MKKFVDVVACMVLLMPSMVMFVVGTTGVPLERAEPSPFNRLLAYSVVSMLAVSWLFTRAMCRSETPPAPAKAAREGGAQ